MRVLAAAAGTLMLAQTEAVGVPEAANIMCAEGMDRLGCDFFNCLSHEGNNAPDCWFFTRFYHEMDGDNWKNNTNWGTATDTW